MNTKLHSFDGTRDRDEHTEREHFFSSAKKVAVITLISRIFGMLRDMAITSLGANRLTDAYGLAFMIPNLFRRLFGEGALASVFVPVFTETSEKEGPEKASKLFANSLGLLAVFLAVIMVMGQIIFVIIALLPGPADRKFLMVLAAVMFPYMLTVCLLALGSATLNCRGHFTFPAAAPIIFNIFGIVAAWWLAPVLQKNLQGRLMIVAFSVVTAGITQLIAVLWLLHRSGFKVRPHLRPIEAGIKPMLRMLGPMLLSLGFLQISELFQGAIAWTLTATEASKTFNFFGLAISCPLTAGVITRWNAAKALYQFPMGVLAIPLGVAVFPLLSRYAARGDTINLRDSINRALRLSLMEGMATGVGLYILAEPIMKLIYARRNFTPEDAIGAAFVLKMYALGMWAYCSYQILVRAFYSLKDTKTPVKVSCALVFFNIALIFSTIWIPKFEAGAFGLSTAATFALNAAILIYLLRRKLGLFGGRRIAVSFARTVVGCAVMTGVVYLLRYQLGDVRNWIVVTVCVPAGAITFFVVIWLLGAPEMGELMGGIKAVKEPEITISQQQ
jgi:putative peptidoglycan lipid II flippase